MLPRWPFDKTTIYVEGPKEASPPRKGTETRITTYCTRV
jgi:hypothetical protein